MVFNKIMDKLGRIVNGQGSIDLVEFELLAGIFVKNKETLEKKKEHFYRLI